MFRIVQSLNTERDLSRTIVHVDMDMFYAAVEMRDNPALRGVPMAVGGMGMLSTSNYAARKFGVRAAMPGFIAKKLCPSLVIVPGNMEKYGQVSEVVRGVFREYDPNFAPMSLDEAYLDITDLLATHAGDSQEDTAWRLVQEMRSKIQERTHLTASAGIAPNCFLAKICSDLNKPDGQYQLRHDPEQIMDFVSPLHIRKVGGIGNVQEQLLRGIGVETCHDLWEQRAQIRLLFSEISSEFYLAVSQGIGSTRLEPREERERKSISTETTFSDTRDRAELFNILQELCQDLVRDCKNKMIVGQSVTVKIKSHDFKIKTKVSQMCDFSSDEEMIHATAKKILTHLLDSSDEQPLALRLMGVRLSNLQDNESNKPRQKNLISFMKDAPSTSKSETNYSCPICDLDCDNLGDLNNHIDNCAQQSAAEETIENKILESHEDDEEEDMFKEYEEVNDDASSTVVVKENESCGVGTVEAVIATTSKQDDDKVEESGTKKQESFFAKYIEMERMRKAEAEAQARKDKIKEMKTKSKQIIVEASPLKLTCPVCSSSEFSEENLLSSHVEDCLSRQTISSILTSERELYKANNNKQNPSKKRKSSEPHKKVDKKCKSNQKNQKIDFFFKLKS